MLWRKDDIKGKQGRFVNLPSFVLGKNLSDKQRINSELEPQKSLWEPTPQ